MPPPDSNPNPLASIRTPWGPLTPTGVPGSGGARLETPPIEVPDHVLVRRIGRGSYGEVWLARNALGLHRAIKILDRAAFEDDRPFEREFAGIQRFEPVSRSHESQLNILHVGRSPGHFYYVMELADDQGRGSAIDEATYAPRSLRSELLFRGRIPVDECLRLGLALSTALDHLHRHGLVHRDIKPSNIVFVNGIPKLADIGLVALAERTMSFVGTEGYLPPEGPGTVQADLFSLGKVLYEISTGNDRQQFPDLPTQLSELPDRHALAEFNEVLVRACAPDPRARYQSAAEMHADLALLQSGGSVARQRRLAGRLRFVQRAGALVTALALLIAVGWGWQARQTRTVRDLAERTQVSERVARERLYAADINLAQQALQSDNLRLARSLLSHHLPEDGQPDLRGFEWRYLWNQCRSEELFSIQGGTNSSRILAFAPDGRHLAVGGHVGGNTRLFDLELRRETALLPETNPIQSLAFSPRDGALAVGSEGGVTLWDTAGTRELRRLPGAFPPAVFSPDGRFLVTDRDQVSATDGSAWNQPRHLTVWDTTRWEPVRSLTLPVEGIPSPSRDLYLQAAFGSDSSRLVVLCGNALQVLRFPELDQARVLTNMLPESFTLRPFVTVSPDNHTVALPSLDGLGVRLWDLDADRELRVLSGHRDHVFSAKFSPDGSVLVTGSPDQATKLWDVATGRLMHTFRGQADEVVEVAFSPDGTRLATLGVARSQVLIWDSQPKTHRAVLEDYCWPQGFDAGGRLVGLAWRGRQALVVDPIDHRVERFPVPVVPRGRPVANKLGSVSSDGRYQGIWYPLEQVLEVWDRRQRSQVCTVPALAPWFSFDLRRDRVLTAFTNTAGQPTRTFWQLPAGTRLHEVPGAPGTIGHIQPTPEGDYLLTEEANPGVVHLWRLADDHVEPVLDVTESHFAIGSAAVSPDGRWLAVSGEDITLRRLPGGAVVGTLMGHTRKGIQLVFSPDSRTLASTADDRTTRLWHLASQRELLRFTATEEDRDLFLLQFSPDGRSLGQYRYHGQAPEVSLFAAPSFAELAVADGGDYRSLPGTDPAIWYAVAAELHRRGRVHEALEASEQAGSHLPPEDDRAWWLAPSLRELRRQLLLGVGRTVESGPLNLERLGLPARDPGTPSTALDLSAFYTASLAWEEDSDQPNDLRELPSGSQVLDGTPFDVRGVIELPSPNAPDASGIPVGRRVQRLHFLQYTSLDSEGPQTGDRVGSYRVRYEDGRSVEIPIRFNLDISDWWELDHLPTQLSEATVAWRGKNPMVQGQGRFIRLFHRTWENPHPEVAITVVDLRAERRSTHLAFVALTAE